MIKFLVSAAVLVSLSASASAQMMKCSSENMAKSTTMMQTMQDGPGKMAMGKEMGWPTWKRLRAICGVPVCTT